MDQDRYIKEIENYLFNKMDNLELNEFNQRLMSESQLREDVDFYKNMFLGSRSVGRQALKNDLNAIHNSKDRSLNNSGLSFYVKLFSTILIIIIGGYFIWNQINNQSNLFEKNYKAYALSNTNRGNDNLNNLDEIFELYNNKKYNSLITEVNTLVEADKLKPNIQLITAISYIENGDSQGSIPFLENIINSNDAFYSDEALWYLSLVYLKLGNQTKTQKYLKLLTSDPESDHYNDAKRVLSQLNG